MNQIKIDLERILSDIDRHLFGFVMEIVPLNARLGYLDFADLDIGDSPNADKSALRSDIRSAFERMNFSHFRFPGGNFASQYHWRDGIGLRQDRPTRHDLVRNCIVANQYGTNEFIRFCRAMNIEPQLTANCGDGDMREAADWVEYCNGTGDSALAKLRRKHGFEAPHNVKYWGVGNEVDSPSQIGYKTPQEYARAFTEFSKVMKRVDPDIKLIASGACSWQDRPLGPEFLYRKTEWVERAQLMLEQAGDRIDYITIHRHVKPYEDDPFENFMAFAQSYNEHLSAYEGLIHAVSLERGIKHAIHIAVDEWGFHRAPASSRKDVPISIDVDERGIMHLPADYRDIYHVGDRAIIALEDALVAALHLNAFIRHAHSVRFANTNPMIMTIGRGQSKRPDNPVLLPQTIFYPIELYSRTCGQLALDVLWYGDTFTGTYTDRTYTGIRTLDVAATLDQSRKQLVVYVVNQSKEEALETTVSLTSGEFAGSVKVCVINGPDIKAENTDEKPNQVGVRETTPKASGKSFNFTFEPHSVTALVCAVT